MNTEELAIKLNTCKNMNIHDINPDELSNLEDIKISRRKSSEERILDFLNEVKNPYFFKINGRVVQIAFSDTERTAEDCLTNVLGKLYK